MHTICSPVKSVRSIRGKPLGGFIFIRVRSILAVWHALTTGSIDVFTLRAWLGCQELRARRCRIGEGTKPEYLVGEVMALLGTGRESQLKKSIERLVKVGLLSWATDDVSVCTTAFETTVGDCREWCRLLACVANNRRKVPVPRRIIRYLAKSRSRTVIGTALGSLLRTLYFYPAKGCLSGGRVKCSWIADTFDLDLRNVKKARGQLIEVGWLVAGEASQISLNRWGLPVEINLLWGLQVVQPNTETPPRNAECEQKSPPPYDKKLSTRSSSNQKLKASGVETRTAEEIKPCLRNITLEDLRDPGRLDRLYDEATAAGLMPRTVSARLKWFAAAERAIQAGERNPCGLFVAIYRRGLWHHITQAQEDLARVKLKRLDFGEDSRPPGMRHQFLSECGEIAA